MENEMKGIQPHTHDDRKKIIEQLIPIVKKQLGDNLVALGIGGSYARNEDSDFSDIELIAFVREPLQSKWEIRKIVDGLYIVVVVDTKENYINKYLDISDVWYASGADNMEAVINAVFIKEINSYKPADIERKCLKHIEKRWHLFQEITAKTLNAIKLNNRDGLPLIITQMVKELLVILAYLNTSPYTTLGNYVKEARDFNKKPAGFDALLDIFTNGKFQELSELHNIITITFSSLEGILINKGLTLYSNEI